MNVETIDPSSCSDEDIILYIQEVRGEDTLHYKANWIILRTLKILVRDYLERKEILKKRNMLLKAAVAPGTLTMAEQLEIDSLAKKK